jgi:hypothetical protein
MTAAIAIGARRTRATPCLAAAEGSRGLGSIPNTQLHPDTVDVERVPQGTAKNGRLSLANGPLGLGYVARAP